jgi:hypothetical protein
MDSTTYILIYVNNASHEGDKGSVITIALFGSMSNDFDHGKGIEGEPRRDIGND